MDGSEAEVKMGPVEACLRAARERIRKPENWGQGSMAMDGRGDCCLMDDPEAARFCLMGSTGTGVGHKDADTLLRDVVGGRTIAFWNDAAGRTHDQVIACISLAIARAKRQRI